MIYFHVLFALLLFTLITPPHPPLLLVTAGSNDPDNVDGVAATHGCDSGNKSANEDSTLAVASADNSVNSES